MTASLGVLADRYGMTAARRSAADVAGHLEQACLQLRRPAAIVHGFTEYCRKHGRPPPAALDQMMQRELPAWPPMATSSTTTTSSPSEAP